MGRGQSLYDWCQEDIENRGYLLEEWDTERNKKEFGLTPQTISKCGHIKVYWKCKYNAPHNSYLQLVTVHIRKDTKCPVCSNKIIQVGFNDLAHTHKQLLDKEWSDKNTINPSTIGYWYKETKLWWKCLNGHDDYLKDALHRIKRNQGCPICAINRRNLYKTIAPYEESLEYVAPDYALLYSPDNELSADIIYPLSNKNRKWICSECGKEYVAQCSNVILRHRKTCKECSLKRLSEYHRLPHNNNSLAELYPEYAKLLSDNNDRTAKEIAAYSNDVYNFICTKCGKKYPQMVYIKVRSGRTTCPKCTRENIADELQYPDNYNDSLASIPEVAKWWSERNEKTPRDVYKGSDKTYEFKCKIGHYYTTRVYSKVKYNIVCPICNGSKSERITSDILEQLQIEYKKEYPVQFGRITRYYDFYLKDSDLCIEIDGLQHFGEVTGRFESVPYEKRITIDSQKNTYLKNNGIPLLRIPGIDTFNSRLSSLNQPILTEEQFKDMLTNIIKQFTTTRKIPDGILEIYKNDSDTNYYQVALQMNEMKV